MAITNKKPVIGPPKIKESKHKTEDSHQITREDSKKEERNIEELQKQLENNEQNGSKYIPINN